MLTADTMPGVPDEFPAAPESVPLDDLAGVVAALRHAEDMVRQWTGSRDELRRILTDRLAEAEVGTIAGRPIVKHTVYTDRRISTKLVRQLAPLALLEACTAESVRRRFSLVDADDGGQP